MPGFFMLFFARVSDETAFILRKRGLLTAGPGSEWVFG